MYDKLKNYIKKEDLNETNSRNGHHPDGDGDNIICTLIQISGLGFQWEAFSHAISRCA
jgi:hypothetical protein